MSTQHSRPVLFTGGRVFDGEAMHERADVRVEGNRIAALGPPGALPADGAQIVDCAGATLMPGLVEAHAHLTFSSAVDRIMPMLVPPVEKHVLCVAHNARTLLDYGFTSAYSGGSNKPLIEVAVRDDINAGYIPGPRLKASSSERNVDGARADLRDEEGLRKWANDMIDAGVDSLKLLVNGRGAMEPEYWPRLNYTASDLDVIAEIARERGVNLSAHAMTADSIKQSVRAGFRAIYHCNFADEEALDMLEEARDRVFVAPAVGILVADAYERFATRAEAEAIGAFEALEGQQRVMPQMRKRGIKVLPGGDYGFAWNPVGRNGRDIEHFVNLFGFTPIESLRAATKYGAELFGLGGQAGEIKQGYLADLILVKGDPAQDVTVFQRRDDILAVMKDGRFHRAPQPATLA